MSPASSGSEILIINFVRELYHAKICQFMQSPEISLKQNLKILSNKHSGDILQEWIGENFNQSVKNWAIRKHFHERPFLTSWNYTLAWTLAIFCIRFCILTIDSTPVIMEPFLSEVHPRNESSGRFFIRDGIFSVTIITVIRFSQFIGNGFSSRWHSRQGPLVTCRYCL